MIQYWKDVNFPKFISKFNIVPNFILYPEHIRTINQYLASN